MEERKTAAAVLSILLIVLIFFTVIMPYINLKREYTISFKTCTVHFKYEDKIDSIDEGYITAQKKLGLCLCNVNDKKPDTTIAKHIMTLYKKYCNSVCPDTVNYVKYNNLDSVLKYRKKAFDTIIMVD